MKKEEKKVIIDALAEQLKQMPTFYLADVSGLNAENTSKLRRVCFEKKVKLVVVKNTLLKKALEQNSFAETGIFSVLEGSTAVMFTETANTPAKVIKEFGAQYGKPVLKGAYVQESLYVGAATLEALVNIKSREELIGDVVGLLQSPVKRVISALQSGGNTISGVVKTLSERPEGK
ncbi:MAG: 50S ribosomal protein L10 [Prevotellaceae bacterium]|jgi:large subunit ribosomal protein L10|nr:50S ribosomal protein L10 [Prevotellaceae bacterium]